MNWKDSLKKKPHRSNYERGAPWRVKDLAEARKFLQDVRVGFFTTMNGKRVDIKDATDSQVLQILKKLNVEVGGGFDDRDGDDGSQ